MISKSRFTHRFGALSNPRGVIAKAVRRATRTAAAPLLAAGIMLGASPVIAQEREQVKVAFEHALPNIEGKKIVAMTVNYPPGGKSLAHHHAVSAFIYA